MLRAPVSADSGALGRLHAETWHAAYTGLLPDRVLADVTVEARTAFWERVLAEGISDRRTVLVSCDGDSGGDGDSDGTPVGFVFTGPCRDAETPEAGEVYAIYVARAHWGRGAGPELIEGAHEALRGAGFDEAFLWVLAGNDRACRFYERHGWQTDGTQVIKDVHDCPVPELRYRRSLNSLNSTN